MKLAVTVNLEDIWYDNDSLANEIRSQIKFALESAVKREVNAAVKDALADQYKEIKAAAKQYGKGVLGGLLKKETV